ncbi:MFS transporter [Akkermansia muciniphila]|uniref:MFS transporter n=1 Tax=Akkermansia muciniphila TaxID=239935 RepID=UPI001BFF054D|nr:MFS transporter [Akkermansia muciniphila]MBT8778174.1 MFS transporter [Akkermansia muciniphila]
MRTFTWPIALLLLGLLFQTVAFAVLNTVVPLWMEQSDAATWEAGLVGAFFFLGNLAGTLMAGGVIRKAGFKGSYQYACVLCAASTLLLLVFPGALAWSGLRLLTGISCALVWVVVESALLRAGTLKTRGILLASYLVVYYLGTVLGQLLLGWFPSDMSLVVTEVCILSAVGMIPLLFVRLESDSAGALSSTHVEVRTLLKRRSVFLGVVGCVISGVVLGTIYCLMPLFLKHQGMDHSSVGYWMALLIAAAILGQWPMGRLADKYGRAFVMKCQSLLVVAACAGLVLKGGLMAPSLVALGLAGFSLYPVAMAWGCEDASRDELVTMNQLLLLSYSIGTLAGPSLTSFLMQRYSDNWMPMVIALVALSFMPVLMLDGRRRRRLSR